MAGSTTKKVMIRRFDREPVAGFVNPTAYLQSAGVELLRPDGSVQLLPYLEVKTVCFVKDFEGGKQEEDRRIFNTRPKMEGLWVRMVFRDGEIADGILSNNLVQLDQFGFNVTPPESYSNNQRLFVPKQALRSMHVLGVVGSPLTRGKRKPVPKEQISLFD